MNVQTLTDGQLDASIRAAHECADSDRLAQFYEEASQRKLLIGETDAALFLLTQAYVFALDAGHDAASSIHQRLLASGREA